MVSDLKHRRRSHYPHLEAYTTRWLDNDVYGHVNNSVYYHFFDALVNGYLIKKCNFHPSTSAQIGLVVHSHCDYFGPVEYPSVLDVGMRVKKLGKSSVTYECAVFEQGAEEVKAVGEFVHVYVERNSRKPMKEGMDASMREALGGLLAKQAKL